MRGGKSTRTGGGAGLKRGVCYMMTVHLNLFPGKRLCSEQVRCYMMTA